MRTHPTFLRYSLAVTAAATCGLVPDAAAQALTPRVGSPIPYRIELPALATAADDGWSLEVQGSGYYVRVGAMDMMDEVDDDELPVSDAEARRLMTTLFMSSDSLLLGLLEESMQEQQVDLQDVVTEIRTLGGQRSGYMRGRVVCECGHSGTIEMNLTVKDGILYMLMFATEGEGAERHEPMMMRIRESLVLADAPPPLGVSPGREVRPIKSRN